MKFTPEYCNQLSKNTYTDYMGITIIEVEQGRLVAEMPIKQEFLAVNGYLHAGSIISLADSTAGFAAQTHLPERAKSFTTIELKSNFLSTARVGILECECIAEHLGRTTMVWRAIVSHKTTKKRLAIFSATQLVLK
jgi:uncharacterized protein (TIGR00369 family)